MARITVRRSGKIAIDGQAIARDAAPAVIRHMIERVSSRTDGNGRALPGYSALYRKQLAATGERPGAGVAALMRSIHLLRAEVVGSRVTMFFGADSATSPRTPRPPPYVFSPSMTPAKQAHALERWRASPKQPSKTPPHNVLLRFLLQGGPGRAPRDLVGISPAGRSAIVRAIEKSQAFRSG